jgi:hypothetical protein
MVLRTPEDDYFLKVPKALRHRLTDALGVGAKIAVWGDEVYDEHPERGPKRVVSRVQMLTGSGAGVPVVCPIRVCTKKSCWRSGGKELWRSLEDSVAQRGLEGIVVLEGVDCLDHCKKGPNAEWQGQDYHHCKPADAETILDAVQRGKEEGAKDEGGRMTDEEDGIGGGGQRRAGGGVTGTCAGGQP